MQIALVTGASGFIGRVLCAALKARGVEVRGLSRRHADGPWERMYVAKLSDKPLAKELLLGVDTVFHLAGKVYADSECAKDEAEYMSVNVAGTRRLLEAAAAAEVKRFVFTSSVKAGGECSEVCLDEAMEDEPKTPYGRTKLQAEQLVLQFSRQHNFHSVVLRLPLVYGPGHKGNLVRMIKAVAEHRFPPLPEFGNQRSMVHVYDVARAAILVAERPIANAQIYIVTDGRPYSTRELYTLIRKALGRAKPRLSIPVRVLRTMAQFGDILGRIRGGKFLFNSEALNKLSSSAWYSSRKIETELGFMPTYDLEKALPEIIAELPNKVERRVKQIQTL